jgi:hypothetical protein
VETVARRLRPASQVHSRAGEKDTLGDAILLKVTNPRRKARNRSAPSSLARPKPHRAARASPQATSRVRNGPPRKRIGLALAAEVLCAARLVTPRAARTIMLVCSLFARLPRYGPSAAGTTRHRYSARLGPGVHEPAARDSFRYRLISRRVVKIGLLIRGFGVQVPGGAPRCIRPDLGLSQFRVAS